MLIRFLKISAILADAMHLFTWLLLAFFFGSGLFEVTRQLGLQGSALLRIYLPAGLFLAVLGWDAFRLWRADEERRRLWLSFLIRTLSAICLVLTVVWIMRPLFRQLYSMTF